MSNRIRNIEPFFIAGKYTDAFIAKAIDALYGNCEVRPWPSVRCQWDGECDAEATMRLFFPMHTTLSLCDEHLGKARPLWRKLAKEDAERITIEDLPRNVSMLTLNVFVGSKIANSYHAIATRRQRQPDLMSQEEFESREWVIQ